MSISEPELGENQDTVPAKRKSPNCFSFYVFWGSSYLISDSFQLHKSSILSTSIKDHKVWHLREEGREHCFPLALFPYCQLSTMVMLGANCCLNPFQGCLSIPCNFQGGSAAVAVMKHAPLLWSVLLSSPTCNKAPLFLPGFVSTFHSHQWVLFRTFLRYVSERFLMEMRSFATRAIWLAGLPWPPTCLTSPVKGFWGTVLPLWGIHG